MEYIKKEIENIVWILPRPRPDYYPGGFPLWFEEKLLKLLGYDYNKDLKEEIIHLFGGMSKYGFKVDINPKLNPDYVGDAHNLPKGWNEKFEVSICDPPYNNEYSKKLYNTGKIFFKRYSSEAVRITKPGGYIIIYHYLLTPIPNNTYLIKRIFIGTRINHKPRVCCIFKKKGDYLTKNMLSYWIGEKD